MIEFLLLSILILSGFLAVLLLLGAILVLILNLHPSNNPAEKFQSRELILPSAVLHQAFEYLIKHGKKGKEWMVAFCEQPLKELRVVTHVYDLECAVSKPTLADPDYGKLAQAMEFYEDCGGSIVGFGHIHPWKSGSVKPSPIDWGSQKNWEELYKGRFFGIVFNNSGVLKVFHKSRWLKLTILGDGVKKTGRNTYALQIEERRAGENTE